MAAIKNGEEVTVGTNEVIYIFEDAANMEKPITPIFVEVTSDNVQLSVGEAIVAAHRSWPSGSKVPLSINQGAGFTLRAKGSVSTAKIVVTY